MRKSQVEILIVDDDDVDRMALQRGFRAESIQNPVTEVANGHEALEYLKKRNSMSPLLIILDLNMPKMNGKEFLTVIREDPNLNKSVVFVCTTSDADCDKDFCYSKHVAGYLVKAGSKKSIVAQARLIKEFVSEVTFPVV